MSKADKAFAIVVVAAILSLWFFAEGWVEVFGVANFVMGWCVGYLKGRNSNV